MADGDIRLEVEDFDTRPAGFAIEALAGIASDDEALKLAYKSQGGPNAGQAITTSTTYAGLSGTFDVALGTFDETGGNSRVVVTIGGVVAADFLLDENPGGGSADASTKVERAVASDLAIANGDLIEITVYRDGGEYVRLDYVELVPTGPAANAVGPVTDSDGAANSIAENAAAGALVGLTALATDADAADSVSYAIDDARFEVDGVGVVRVATGAVIDAETETSITVRVTATSTDGSTSFNDFTIDVTDVNEFLVGQSVDTNAAPNTIAEGAPAGTLVGLTALAVDPDVSATVSYSINDPRFTIDANGVVRVAAGAVFDAGTEGSINVVIGALSSDTSSTDTPFVITVTDTPPPPADPIRLEAEDFDTQPGGTQVAAIGVASEGEVQEVKYKSQGGPDNNQPVTTSTTYDGPSGSFDLFYGGFDENDGDSRIVIEIDGVEVADFVLDQDPGGSDADASSQIRREVATGLAVNDGDTIEVTIFRNSGEYVRFDFLDLVPTGPVNSPVGPVSDINPDANTLAEDAAPGTQTGITVVALDPGDTVTYSVDDARFDVQPILADANIVVASGASFDAETESSIDVTVTATSTDGSSSQQSFTIDVSDVDEVDVGPVIDNELAVNGIAEDAAAGTPTGITALATDGDISDSVSYSIDDTRFSINPVTGAVTVAAGATFDAGAEPVVTVEITATSTDTSTSSQTFDIAVAELPPPPVDPIRLEAEDFDTQPGGTQVASIGVASEGEVQEVKYRSQGGPNNNQPVTTSTTYDGPSGEFDLFYGGFDENDGDSRIVVEVNGNEVADFVLDQNPGGLDPDASSQVRREVANGIEVNDGDLIEVTIFRNDGEYVRFDFLDLVPLAPPVPLGAPPAAFHLSALDGTSGFRLDGIDDGDYAGFSVSGAGDVNGDGFADVIVGAYGATVDGNYHAGESYILFGSSAGFPSSIALSMLDGTNGFKISGFGYESHSGGAVSGAGDVNGDGFDDVIIGAYGNSPNNIDEAGSAYVVFGASGGFAAEIALSTLNGSNGFVIDGAIEYGYLGYSVSGAGDVNGDGIDDVIVGGPAEEDLGSSFVVFGSTGGFSQRINVCELNGTNGFRIVGEEEEDYSGHSVSAAGDINGDGIADVIIGAPDATVNGYTYAGASYVVFGSTGGFGPVLELSTLDGSNGFRLNGVSFEDYSGVSVSAAGDFNGDGIGDLIIGAPDAWGNFVPYSGESYLVFGSSAGFSASLDLSTLDGSNGFRIDGSDFFGHSGAAVSRAGDFNGDGFDDVLVSAPPANANGYYYSGKTYLIFGASGGFGSSLNLADLNGSNGFRLDGVYDFDFSGTSVSGAGDINGDGFDDLIVGSPQPDFFGLPPIAAAAPLGPVPLDIVPLAVDQALYSGEAYVIFGGPNGPGSANPGYNTTPVIEDAVFANVSHEPAGTVVGQVIASDADPGDTLSFFIQEGTGRDEFSIDENGVITTNQFVNGIFSGGRELVVEVVDSKGYVARATVTIEEAPAPTPVAFKLAELDGTNGFVINGVDEGDFSGYSVSGAGDVNGDGFADLIIGAYRADANGNDYAGESYVVFGASGGFGSSLDLSTLNGSNGFRIDGIDRFDHSGISVSGAGDVNGDSIDDLIIGARGADPNGNNAAGESYVVFGASGGFGTSLDLSTLNGSNGFRIDGIDEDDFSGWSVGDAGDVNGDGFADLIIGAHSADPNGNDEAGESYVVFGASGGFAASLDLSTLNGSNGFRIDGIDEDDDSSRSVSGAGDVNGDGFADLIIGAPGADDDGNDDSGESYVVFGASGGFGSSLNLSTLNGSNGFRIDGADEYDNSGFSVSGAGDVNGDGFADLIIGAPFADPNGNDEAGESYVVFGASGGFGSSLDLSTLNGSNGFRIDGIDGGDRFGFSVSGAGDVNGDGFADLIVGAYYAGPDGNEAGESYLVFGASGGFAASLDLSTLDGSNGFRIDGIDGGDRFGQSVSGAGDVNGDGFDDLIFGTFWAAANGNDFAGESYVIFGGPNGPGSAVPDYNTTPDAREAHFSVRESQSPGSLIGFVGAFDPDFGGPLTYSIRSGNDDGLFSINNGGELTFSSALNHEIETGRVLQVEVADSKGYVGRAEVTVAVRELAEAPFGASIAVSALDGTNGFTIQGSSLDRLGASVSDAGDVNNDGIADVIVGAYRFTPNAVANAGAAYVVYGSTGGFSASFAAASIDGTNGFRLNGVLGQDYAGLRVSGAGDFNGDGIDDILLASSNVDVGLDEPGAAYVVFGVSGGLASSINLSELTGTSGFRIPGLADGDNMGSDVSNAGDVNDDGIDDIIIGARSADSTGGPTSGVSYVLFGSTASFSADFDLSSLDGSNGFRLDGAAGGDSFGRSVGGVDINGDGIDDLLAGATFTDPGGDSAAGSAYVVFGTAGGFSAIVNVSNLDGSDGFRLDGVEAGDLVGQSISGAGDVNGDGIDDLIVGAWGATADTDGEGVGYVLFGSTGGFSAAIDLAGLDGSDGFRIDGVGIDDATGWWVSGAGDFNGDGFDDLIIGAQYADPVSNNEGAAYLVFGGASFGSSLELSALGGSQGFRIDGVGVNDNVGYSVSAAGDLNGDGFDDVIVGSNGPDDAYILFGFGKVDRTIDGTPGDDLLVGGLGDDTLTGMTGNDRFVISEGDDTFADFARGEDVIGLEGLFQGGVAPGTIGDYVELTIDGPNAVFAFDENGAGDFSVAGREGTATLTGVDLIGNSLQDLLDDGTLSLGGDLFIV